MRITGWIQLIFVSLLAMTSWFFPLKRSRRTRVTGLALIAITAIALGQWTRRSLTPLISSVVNDWLPAVLLLVPYWQIGQFFTGANTAKEARLAAFDQWLYRRLGIRPSQSSIGSGLATYFQLAYLLVYPLIPLGLAALYIGHMRQYVDYYWVVILLSVYLSFVITLFVPALPPRLLPGSEEFAMPSTKLGIFNRAILNRASIQAITFPSAHVASSVTAALVLVRVEPWIGAIFFLVAISIAVATVVCGYHYAADVVLAMAIAILVFGVVSCFWLILRRPAESVSILRECARRDVMTTASIPGKGNALRFQLRQASVVAKAMKSRRHPIVAHVVPIRRCNLACAYCNEYDDFSKPVPLVTMLRRIDCLAELGTTVITISGGEPLLHPELDEIIRQIRKRGSIATLITNGFLLTPERIQRLNHAGLDQLQISIDNETPDDVSMKSLKVLDKKLQALAQHAMFQVSINSVIGASARPEDALAVTSRARELGFATTVGVVHDGQGQLRPLEGAAQMVYREIMQTGRRSAYTFAYYNQFQKNLIEGKTNNWDCRAGSRYLYICEDGLVHYCSQKRGRPGIPLEQYGEKDLEREYHSVKGCASRCTVSCVHQVSMIDAFRDRPREALARFFPAKSALGGGYKPPAVIRMLTWMFLPPEGSKVRKKLTEAFTQVAFRLLHVP